jgi:ABC-type methionine transport system ATPase subunit
MFKAFAIGFSKGIIAVMESINVQLSAGKQSVGEPWIWRLSKDFNIVVNIVRANVDADFGSMEVELKGEVEDIQRAIAWLMTTGLHVESQRRAVGA